MQPSVDYEAEYNNRARVPEHPAIFARWKDDAARFRNAHRHAECGVAYGPSPRQTVDLFWPDGSRNAPIAVFIHGGYWQSLDPSGFSHLAAGANANGIALALPGYDLCPQVPLRSIVGQMEDVCRFLWRRHGRRLVVSGHSAGGHLAACLLSREWPALDRELPSDFVPAALSISGLFDLLPLVGTSINKALGLDEEEARALSPAGYGPRGKLEAWVGAEESGEFRRQSRLIAGHWQAAGADAAYCEIPGANHFTAIDPLIDPSSAMSRRLADMVMAVG
jgi:arylformamidase